MSYRIIRIAITFAAALFIMEGCLRTIDELTPHPDNSADVIKFEVEPLMFINDDATKAQLKEGTEFSTNDIISVYGRHHTTSDDELIFNSVDVTKGSSGWSYAPVQSWNWQSGSDYYDFIAVYPNSAASSRMNISGNIAVKTDFNMASDNYDLLCAAIRRSGNESNRGRVVPFSFQHMLSAVKVVIINDSDNTNFTVNSISFKNLVVSGSMKTTLNALGEPDFMWINTERSSGTVRSWAPGSLVYANNNEGPHSYEKANPYDLMIPGPLNVSVDGSNNDDKMPQLNIQYTPTGGVLHDVPPIILKDIEREDHTLITSWSPATKYAYYITIRTDGGVLVNVITTEWNTVNAETPGLLID